MREIAILYFNIHCQIISICHVVAEPAGIDASQTENETNSNTATNGKNFKTHIKTIITLR